MAATLQLSGSKEMFSTWSIALRTCLATSLGIYGHMRESPFDDEKDLPSFGTDKGLLGMMMIKTFYGW